MFRRTARSFPSLFRILEACLGCALIWGHAAYSQGFAATSAQTLNRSVDWTIAENRWQQTPADASSEGDTVSPEVRNARNEYFAALLKDASSGGGIGDFDSKPPDVGNSKEDRQYFWVVATFESSNVYSADKSNGLLYTEIHLRVDRVIANPSRCSAVVGSTIDTYLLSGSLKTKDGVVHSSRLWPEKFSLEPGHRYILALVPEPARLFVEAKGWDVTDGTVKVSSEIDEAHIAHGHPTLVGLPLADAVRTIKETLTQCAPDAPSCLDWTNAANRWRQIPVDQVSQTDPVPAEVRAARNEALLPVLNMFPCGGGIVDYVYEPPEVVTAGYFRDVTWVVGTFESYRVISANSSNEALYTEMTFRIKTVIFDPNLPAVTERSTVDTYDLCGSLRTLDGVEHGAHFAPERYGVTPGHTYILGLHHFAAGLRTGPAWDVTSGVVEPEFWLDENRVKEGKAKVVGKPLAEAIQYIRDAHTIRGSIWRGDKGCPEASAFKQTAKIAADDFIELRRMYCSTDCPLYSVRVYGDGRLVWHGDSVVKAMGDAAATVDAGEAQAMIAHALTLGFGGLCDEYVQEYGQGRTVWQTSLSVAGQTKTIFVKQDSDEPVWLDRLFDPMESLPVVRGWIGDEVKPVSSAHTPWR